MEAGLRKEGWGWGCTFERLLLWISFGLDWEGVVLEMRGDRWSQYGGGNRRDRGDS